MQLQIVVDRAAQASLQAQIFDQVREMILDGRLRPGAPLPSSRVLSDGLGVSRNTVLLAYDRLATEGYLGTRAASHTYVSEIVPESALTTIGQDVALDDSRRECQARAPIVFSGRAPRLSPMRPNRPPIDFWVGCPHAKAFPRKIWRGLLLRNLLTAGTNLTEYGDPAGHWQLREALAEHLGRARGIRAKPAQIIVVHGVQEALNIVARLLIGPGSQVVVEDPCYQGAAFLFESYGARLAPVRVDHAGLLVDQLPEAGVSLAYVTPTHQFPTGVTMSPERRAKLLGWARDTGAYIVEGDYDSDFRYDGPPLKALCGLDHAGSVVYLGTFSKSLGAGLRTGYMVVPPSLQKQAATVRALTSYGQSWLEQASLADLLRTGAFSRHLRLIRQRYLEARDALVESLCAAFGPVDLTGEHGGMHLLWHLPAGFPSAVETQAIARSQGVGVYDVEKAGAYVWQATGIRERALALGYASLSPEMIREGVQRLAKALGEESAATGTRE